MERGEEEVETTVARMAKAADRAEPIENQDIKLTDPNMWAELVAKLKGTDIFHAFKPIGDDIDIKAASTPIYSEKMSLDYNSNKVDEDIPFCLMCLMKPKTISFNPETDRFIIAKEGLVSIVVGPDGKEKIEHLRWKQVKQIRLGKMHVLIIGERRNEAKRLEMIEKMWVVQNPLGLGALLSVYKLQSNEVEDVEGTTLADFLKKSV